MMNKPISYRGHTNQIIESRSNEPTYIDSAISNGYTVAVDIFHHENNLWLGTNEPVYQISIEWLVKRIGNLLLNLKNKKTELFISSLPQNFKIMKHVLVLGGGGFIGGHIAKRLKNEGHWVRIVDLKPHEYFNHDEICDEFIIGDLRNPITVGTIMKSPKHPESGFDEVYQLAADMGGAGYIFTGEHDADIMHNSATINLNVAKASIDFGIKKLFYSSSACIYPSHNQEDPNNPNCEESSAYPANPDSEYGWEKIFSERLYLAYNRNYGLNVRIARFHNVFGECGAYKGGKEKAPAAMCRKASEANDGDEIEVWGYGTQTRSFLYIDECVEAVMKLMNSDFMGPVNIGSDEMVTINELAEMAISLTDKVITIKNLSGAEFEKKYGHKCPIGVNGRNSDNTLYEKRIGWVVSNPLIDGMTKTYTWINNQKSK